MPRRGRSRSRGESTFSKPALTAPDLLRRWTDRGLVVHDPEKAARYLRHVGYYRLSPYVRTFESSRDCLAQGTSFEDVLTLYVFDRRLRLLMLDALERIEVALRASLGDHMAVRHGPHWYLDPAHFSDARRHQRLLDEVRDLVARQLSSTPERAHDGSFVSAMEHYVTSYKEPDLPPSWVVLEELSLGTLRALYGNLANGDDRQEIAASLGLNDKVLTSWLRTYQRVRNICAHHGRLWNRGLGVYPLIPTSPWVYWLDDRSALAGRTGREKRLYAVVVSIQSVLHTISPYSTWALRLRALFEEYPDIPLGPMGFPEDWHGDPFWPIGSERRRR